MRSVESKSWAANRRWLSAWVLLALFVVIAGCTAHRGYQQALSAEEFGRWDEAVLHYLELVDKSPQKVVYRNGLLRAKIRASQEHFKRAREYQEADLFEQALAEYRQAVQLDPTNQFAQVEYEKLRGEMQAARREGGSSSLEDLKRRTRGSRPQPPILNPRSDEPISLSFPKPVPVFDIYRALGKAFGINVLFDPKLRGQDISIELQEVVAQDALEILMRTASHFYKVLDEQTIIVAEDNPQNRRNYEDLVIQTFFLSNAEVKDVMTMLRSLVGAKNIAANDQLNAIVLRDTADKVKVAERIILTNDKSRGEVVIDVELLQISTSKLQELGVSLSEYRVTQSLDPNPIRASEIGFLNQGNWLLNLPAFVYDFVKSSSEAQLLASPQLRISDGEQATLHIGNRVPIPVTTFNTGATVGGNIVPITSFQYQDVGIRLDLQPRIHHNRQVSLQLTVEVSQISGSVPAGGGQSQPIIGTRTIESTIRLQNGETNFLAGLIRSDETTEDSGFPGLADIPVLGRLFSKKKTDLQRTDLVLTLTPHIVRTPDITEQDLLPIWVGTEANITFRGGSPRVESEVEGPFDEDEERGAERIREMIRRRIQNLPRGLRDTGQEEQEDTPPGVELVPSAAPADAFRPSQDDDGDDDSDGAMMRSLIFLPETDDEPEEPPAEARAQGGAAAAAATQAPIEAEPDRVLLALEPARVEVEVGREFEVRLMADSARPISHLPLTFAYDPDVVTLVRVESGGYLGDERRAKVLSDASRPGRLVLGASRLGEVPGVTGRGVVATLVFRAEARGETGLTFETQRALDPGLRALSGVRASGSRVAVVAAGAIGVERGDESPGGDGNR